MLNSGLSPDEDSGIYKCLECTLGQTTHVIGKKLPPCAMCGANNWVLLVKTGSVKDEVVKSFFGKLKKDNVEDLSEEMIKKSFSAFTAENKFTSNAIGHMVSTNVAKSQAIKSATAITTGLAVSSTTTGVTLTTLGSTIVAGSVASVATPIVVATGTAFVAKKAFDWFFD